MFKKTSLLLLPLTALFFISGCAQSLPASPDAPMPSENSDLVKLDTSESSYNSELPSEVSLAPAVLEITESSFVLVDGGSSSCPKTIDSVVYDKEEASVNIYYEVLPPETPCTRDFVLKATQINFDNFTLPLADEPNFFTFNGGSNEPTVVNFVGGNETIPVEAPSTD